MSFCFVFFFKQKTAYEMRISDWSSDVCSSDLLNETTKRVRVERTVRPLPMIESCAKLQQLSEAAMPQARCSQSNAARRIARAGKTQRGWPKSKPVRGSVVWVDRKSTRLNSSH